MAPKMKFQEGEKVLCFHGPLLYEAKCVKYEIKDKGVRYFIHYNGWNKNWDEWVPESRVVKCNDAGMQKQKELMKAHGNSYKRTYNKGAKSKEKEVKKLEKEGKKQEKESKKQDKQEKEMKKQEKETKKQEKQEKEQDKQEKEAVATPVAVPEKVKQKVSRSATPTPAAAEPPKSEPAAPIGTEPKRKRLRPDPTVESEEAYMAKIDVKIKIPDELKPWLVDDWDLITRQKMLLTLPCRRTVDQILEDFLKSKTAKGTPASKDAYVELSLGIKEYFNVMLGTQLLYKFERPQYGEIVNEKGETPVTMSSIYGATHLLRLFVKLGGQLAYTSLDEKSMQLLLNHINEFVKYLQKNSSSLFSLNDYHVAPPEYHRKAI
ncbi:mortality factor 4-like protein 1 [Gigantopelta aegis]|uniref:mortality factor 4-like protein 1 n=1 Tax=Gigantopelta aegis TaxID=1735272 RepID=UPI001B88E306|nr:mortality factor 4-like protein 1 [Gigantopelta aegis]